MVVDVSNLDRFMKPMSTRYCSFCGAGNLEVKRMIEAPKPSILICDECIETCRQICADEVVDNPPDSGVKPKPLAAHVQSQPDLETIANEAFAQFNCPGAEACKGSRPSHFVEPHNMACESCKAPPHVFHKGVKVYRSYADYCDD